MYIPEVVAVFPFSPYVYGPALAHHTVLNLLYVVGLTTTRLLTTLSQ